LLLMLAAVADLGIALIAMMQLTSGVANAARYAQLTQGTATTTTLQTIVQDASFVGPVKTTVSAPACFCASGTPLALTAETCGTSCTNGAPAGTYQTITATYSYVPALPGYDLLASNLLSQTVTVQVK
jgi:Flp pilus assembly protein TadG